PFPWPASERTSAASFHDHPAAPFLRPSAAGATAAPETAALLSTSTHGRSIPPPSPAYTLATASPSPFHGVPQEPLTAGASSHGAAQSWGTSGKQPSDPAGSLRLGTGCSRGVPPPPRAGGYRGSAARWVVYLYAADNSIGPRIRYNPPVHHQVRGFCHDTTPFFLPVGVPGTPVAVCHAARCLAQPMRDGPGHASHAHPAAASTLQGAQAVCRPHPQALLCPV